jgi:hypothetical protein
VAVAWSWPLTSEVNECVELYLRSLNTPSWRGAQLQENTGKTLPFYLTMWIFTKRSNHQNSLRIYLPHTSYNPSPYYPPTSHCPDNTEWCVTHSAPHYIITQISVSLPPSQVQLFSWVLYFDRLVFNVLPSK